MKRAKEKARLRKSQQKQQEAGSAAGSLLCGTSPGSHCGPLLSLPQDCMNTSHQSQADIDVEAYSNPIDVLNSSRTEQRQPNGCLTNGSLTRDSSSSAHGSMQRQQRLAAQQSLARGDDDIYTLPVDSCRPGQARPISLHMAAEAVQQQQQLQQSHSNSMTR